ncbi:pre-16S rRNA-processing nuclease YqgF [Synechocystis sp. PCC 7339]|uniref:pre-16S rRNA-processing nuclease YqgF n=1 Tax=unclassified Synechocystis TaxID=2640012 RepID=UPI001BAF5859|nr:MULTISPECIES: pre-16S rRNA-processing nuclease YqgF [unclassified Synechocystis]QUS60399.1 pre-16S rRNA-processing nuclease YqgF [Synechocystis sp. PCC 7338]UAJ72158.1 pre-16S rRNA-processing nuclease YqgF [Synechocystis sp. PCC 7339]
MNYLGFDPGRDKCGVAVMTGDRQILYHETIAAQEVSQRLPVLCEQYQVGQVVMGNQTTAKQWQKELQSYLPPAMALALVNEKNSTVEARQRYWQMYPPQGLGRLVPLGLRTPPRPVDDIVAILLIERYLDSDSGRC